MAHQWNLESLSEKCDIYFGNSLISKERIISEYADFCLSTQESKERIVGLTLHTGSICFDIISLIIATLRCLAEDDTQSTDIIDSLEPGNMVLYLYGNKKQEKRYYWRGFAAENTQVRVQNSTEAHFVVLDQGDQDVTFVPRSRWNLIVPYYGESQTADGRGIKGKKSSRNDFLSYLFEVPEEDIPSAINTSIVIISDREEFSRMAGNTRIVYGNNQSIGLLDIATASYYAGSGEEYPIGSNPSRNEPVIKVTSKVSVARDLVLARRANRAVGLVVMGAANITKSSSEMEDLMMRKSLRFVHLSDRIDAPNAEYMLDISDDINVFACTKEYLLQNSLPVAIHNSVTDELERQINTIIDNTISTVIVEGGCSWDEYRQIKQSLVAIKNSAWNEEDRDRFVINAYSLLNIFITAAFSMCHFEEIIKKGTLISSIRSPEERINDLWTLADKAGDVDMHCLDVIDLLDRLYRDNYTVSGKNVALQQHLSIHRGKSVLVVPKAYYVDVLSADEAIAPFDVGIVTSNRFAASERYDEIIVLGDFSGKRFDALNCRSATYITIMLYDCETHVFRQRRAKRLALERKWNAAIGIVDESDDNILGFSSDILTIDHEKEIKEFAEMSGTLDRFIEEIGTLDLRKFATSASASSSNTPTATIKMVGRFVNGDQILFSEFYYAVVFDNDRKTVRETGAEKLSGGDILVFTKRNDYTRNMVDLIYENLLESNRLNTEVVDASEKEVYWKEVLREYMDNHQLTYKGISQALRPFGSTLGDGAVRQWLHEGSHTVGPKRKESLRHVAELTQDELLLDNPYSFFEACQIVRKQRKEILRLISKAIVDQLSGNKPDEGSILEIVYENVDRLSEVLELESVQFLDEPIMVPINLINRPLSVSEMEVTL